MGLKNEKGAIVIVMWALYLTVCCVKGTNLNTFEEVTGMESAWSSRSSNGVFAYTRVPIFGNSSGSPILPNPG